MRNSALTFLAVAIGTIVFPTVAVSPSERVVKDAVNPIAKAQWYKGNLHTHTLWSDGNDYPEMIADWYRSHGYHFLALTDHNQLSQGDKWVSVAMANARAKRPDAFRRYRRRFGDDWVETRRKDNFLQVRLKPLGEIKPMVEQPGRFLLIPGEEITDSFDAKPIHTCTCNVTAHIPPQGGKSVVDTINNNLSAVAEQSARIKRPMLAQVNHPNFGFAITAEEMAAVTQARYFEIFSGHPDVHQNGDKTHPSVERMWDVINTIRIGQMKSPPILGMGVDDTHNYFGLDWAPPGRAWVMVRSRYLTPESIVKGIQAGDFYASTGVSLSDIRFSAEEGTFDVEIEPDATSIYTIQFIGTRKGVDPARKTSDESDVPRDEFGYSREVGRVLAVFGGTKARYRLSGDELYVRAVVTSSRVPEHISFPGQKRQAWTQPVGFEKWLAGPKTEPAIENGENAAGKAAN